MTNVPIPTDADHFLRRECPTCGQQFKWHLGPVDDQPATEPAPVVYYCPLCGVPANTDQWWTAQQLEYAQARAMPELLAELSNDTGLHIEAASDVPAVMVEPNDMDIVQSPCHPREPIKIPHGYNEPINCLVCGATFAV